jgi:hypothetical protein
LYEGGTQKQVFGRVTAKGQFRGQQQSGAIGVGLLRGVHNFPDVAIQITHEKIELRDAQLKSHEPAVLCNKP